MKKIISALWKLFHKDGLSRRNNAALLLSIFAGLLNASLSAQTVSTVGGGSGSTYPGPYSGYLDGPFTRFNQPAGLAMDPAGNYLFVADYSNNVVRFMSTPATSGRQTYTFTNAINPNLAKGIIRPVAVAVDAATNVYAEPRHQRIRFASDQWHPA